MPKVYRTFADKTTLLEIPTTTASGELQISITDNFGTEAAQTLSIGLRADIAEVMIKALYNGMRIEENDVLRPQFRVEP